MGLREHRTSEEEFLAIPAALFRTIRLRRSS